MQANEDIDGWVVIGTEPGLRQLAFQLAEDWIPPRWPDPRPVYATPLTGSSWPLIECGQSRAGWSGRKRYCHHQGELRSAQSAPASV